MATQLINLANNYHGTAATVRLRDGRGHYAGISIASAAVSWASADRSRRRSALTRSILMAAWILMWRSGNLRGRPSGPAAGSRTETASGAGPGKKKNK